MRIADARPLVSHLLSDAVWVALRPAQAYTRLAGEAAAVRWRHVLEYPAIALLAFAIAVPIIAVGRVTAMLVLTTALAASLAIAVQAAAAAVLVASAPGRAVRLPAALHLLFAGHLPWTLWLAAVAAATVVIDWLSLPVLAATMAVPAAWTMAILLAFCRIVLGATARGARVRVAAHQALIWSCVLSFAAWGSGGWFRLLG